MGLLAWAMYCSSVEFAPSRHYRQYKRQYERQYKRSRGGVLGKVASILH
jgi:hypothetical protein